MTAESSAPSLRLEKNRAAASGLGVSTSVQTCVHAHRQQSADEQVPPQPQGQSEEHPAGRRQGGGHPQNSTSFHQLYPFTLRKAPDQILPAVEDPGVGQFRQLLQLGGIGGAEHDGEHRHIRPKGLVAVPEVGKTPIRHSVRQQDDGGGVLAQAVVFQLPQALHGGIIDVGAAHGLLRLHLVVEAPPAPPPLPSAVYAPLGTPEKGIKMFTSFSEAWSRFFSAFS